MGKKKKSGKHKPREPKRTGWIDFRDEFWEIAQKYIPKPKPHGPKGGDRQPIPERYSTACCMCYEQGASGR